MIKIIITRPLPGHPNFIISGSPIQSIAEQLMLDLGYTTRDYYLQETL